eukprot:143457-Rhodomonas_salina.1
MSSADVTKKASSGRAEAIRWTKRCSSALASALVNADDKSADKQQAFATSARKQTATNLLPITNPSVR